MGQGCVSGEYTNMHLNPEVQPVVHATRKIPVAIREKVKAELDRMRKLNVISKEGEPKMGKLDVGGTHDQTKRAVRICLDPRDLSKAIKKI